MADALKKIAQAVKEEVAAKLMCIQMEFNEKIKSALIASVDNYIKNSGRQSPSLSLAYGTSSTTLN